VTANVTCNGKSIAFGASWAPIKQARLPGADWTFNHANFYEDTRYA
jgi:hypothetical protein